jgi:membrane associated rhomboid family serine protease
VLPIKDTIRSRSVPLVNWLIIVANILVFLYQTRLSPLRLEQFINTYGLVPANLDPTNPATWMPLITHMFLHGGWLHILSNLWILFIFGDNVEDRLGSLRYLLFYFIGGIVAGLVQIYFSLDPLTPSIGASGAIAAVLGGYFSFYPRSKVITLIPIFIIPWFVELPSFLFLGFWFVSQLFQGLMSLATPSGQVGGVAWWAHIGGFIFGLLTVRLFAIGRSYPQWHADQYWPW